VKEKDGDELAVERNRISWGKISRQGISQELKAPLSCWMLRLEGRKR